MIAIAYAILLLSTFPLLDLNSKDLTFATHRKMASEHLHPTGLRSPFPKTSNSINHPHRQQQRRCHLWITCFIHGSSHPKMNQNNPFYSRVACCQHRNRSFHSYPGPRWMLSVSTSSYHCSHSRPDRTERNLVHSRAYSSRVTTGT